MDREQFLRGVAALKSRIKELSAVQKEAKAVLRLPRKTEEDRAKLHDEVNRVEPSRYGFMHDVAFVQSRVAMRRYKISAYLNVYAQVRGKPPCHTPRDGWNYLPRLTKSIREEFDKACGTTSEQCSAQCQTGKTS